MRHPNYYRPLPRCDKCGRFISYRRATLHGKLVPPPMVGWVEWFTGICSNCAPSLKVAPITAENAATE